MTPRWHRSVAVGSVLAVLTGCAPVSVPQAPTSQVSPVATTSAASPPSSSAPSSPRPKPAAELRITSVSNFRDVAGVGEGLVLASGGRMTTGLIYRSAKLNTINAADEKRLLKAGIAEVIDLRTDAVAARSPDPRLAGVSRRHVNLYAVYASPVVTYRSVSAAEQHMRQLNIDFVADPAQRRQVARVLRLLAAPDGPALIHCTEGKDRTGWMSALLQLVAGVDQDQVMAEYLKSNEYRATIIADRFRATRARSGLNAARVERALLTVDASYLKAGLTELETRYGGLSGYLAKGLGLSPRIVATLRQRLTS